jgi:hypothetical protein
MCRRVAEAYQAINLRTNFSDLLIYLGQASFALAAGDGKGLGPQTVYDAGSVFDQSRTKCA